MSRFTAKHVAVLSCALLVVVAFGIALREFAEPPGDTPGTTENAPPESVRVHPERLPADPARPEAPGEAVPNPPREGTALLVVKVVSSANRAATEGATVEVTDADCAQQTKTTDAAGTARFDDLPQGATEVRAWSKELFEAKKTVVLAPSARADVEFALDAARSVEGVVVAAGTGAAIPDAEVELTAPDAASGDERPLGDARTDEEGRFQIAGVPAGEATRLHVRAKGFRPSGLDRAPGTAEPVRVQLEPTGALRGVVRDRDGKPVEGARVIVKAKASPGAEAVELSAVSGKDGSYVVHDVPVGAALVVTAGGAGWADSLAAESKLDAATAGDAPDLVVRRPARLTVRVPDPREKGEDPGTLVMVRVDEEPVASVLSWPHDRLVRENVTPGLRRVRVSADGFLPDDRRVPLAEGEDVSIDVKLQRGLAITGIVVDASGAGIAGAVVTAADFELPANARGMRYDFGQKTIAGDDGTFRVRGLRSRTYRVSASVPNGADSARLKVMAPSDGQRFVIARGTEIALRVAPPMEPPSGTVYVTQCMEAPRPNFAGDDDLAITPEPAAWARDGALVCEVAPGTTWLRVCVPGRAPAVIEVRPEAGKRVDLGAIRFEPAVALTGRVVTPDGKPVAGASVGTSGRPDLTPERTKDDGSFVLRDLAPGAVVIRATAPGRAAAAAFDAAPRADPAEIVLRRTGFLRGTVVDADGVPVAGAAVVVRDGLTGAADDLGRRSSSVTDELGRFEFAVIAGACRATAGGAWVDADVREGGEAVIRVVTP